MNSRYSIHILNYNYDPEPILDALTRQILAHRHSIQMILWDDFSEHEYRTILSRHQKQYNFPFLVWQLEENNIGRTAMRQKILDYEQSGWLVSIDSDMLVDDDFIDQMVSALKLESTVYTGRHYYQYKLPSHNYRLHWNYGRQREVRIQEPYLQFSTGIFAVHSSLAPTLYFDADLSGYGHEDTSFGLLLKQKQIPVVSVPMKAVHLGLSEFEVFIDKQLVAVRNLQVVLSKHPDYNSRLIIWAHRIEKIPFINTWISSERFRSYCIKRLHQNPGNLLFLDLLKLSTLLDSGSRI